MARGRLARESSLLVGALARPRAWLARPLVEGRARRRMGGRRRARPRALAVPVESPAAPPRRPPADPLRDDLRGLPASAPLLEDAFEHDTVRGARHLGADHAGPREARDLLAAAR